ncbi:MAG: hypothetical protein ACLTSG_14625 [Lachnospiraceae bacterium]
MLEDEQGRRAAKLRIFPGCANLIRTLPQLRYDDKRVNDVAQEPHELTPHAADAATRLLQHIGYELATIQEGAARMQWTRDMLGITGASPRGSASWSSAGGRPADKEET